MEWKTSYSCFDNNIDEQHKRLIEIGDRLYNIAIQQHSDHQFDFMQQIFLELKEYTIYHFGYEEELMLQHEYSEYESHQNEHRMFVKKIKEFEDRFKDSTAVIRDMILFFMDWIVQHIMKSDKEYAITLFQ